MSAVASKKRCGKCAQAKLLTQFVKDASRSTGYLSWCLACHAAREGGYRSQRVDAELNGRECPVCDTPIRGAASRKYCSEPCRGKVSRLKRLYNISIQDYRKIVDDSAGRCLLCQKRPSQFALDHSHRKNDNRVFGVVCHSCNQGALAWTFHDPEYIKRLLDFITNPPAERLGIFVRANPENHRPQRIHTVWKHRSKSKG